MTWTLQQYPLAATNMVDGPENAQLARVFAAGNNQGNAKTVCSSADIERAIVRAHVRGS